MAGAIVVSSCHRLLQAALTATLAWLFAYAEFALAAGRRLSVGLALDVARQLLGQHIDCNATDVGSNPNGTSEQRRMYPNARLLNHSRRLKI
jgi:hypothetical protein